MINEKSESAHREIEPPTRLEIRHSLGPLRREAQELHDELFKAIMHIDDHRWDSSITLTDALARAEGISKRLRQLKDDYDALLREERIAGHM